MTLSKLTDEVIEKFNQNFVLRIELSHLTELGTVHNLAEIRDPYLKDQSEDDAQSVPYDSDEIVYDDAEAVYYLESKQSRSLGLRASGFFGRNEIVDQVIKAVESLNENK